MSHRLMTDLSHGLGFLLLMYLSCKCLVKYAKSSLQFFINSHLSYDWFMSFWYEIFMTYEEFLVLCY
jgi:hypothetical protein